MFTVCVYKRTKLSNPGLGNFCHIAGHKFKKMLLCPSAANICALPFLVYNPFLKQKREKNHFLCFYQKRKCKPLHEIKARFRNQTDLGKNRFVSDQNFILSLCSLCQAACLGQIQQSGLTQIAPIHCNKYTYLPLVNS